ncbi:hypothetical protein D3C81_1250760 [compost metagenome]
MKHSFFCAYIDIIFIETIDMLKTGGTHAFYFWKINQMIGTLFGVKLSKANCFLCTKPDIAILVIL